MDASTKWLVTLAPSFFKTLLYIGGIFVMDFYSASRDKVFIAVASYNIKGSMATGPKYRDSHKSETARVHISDLLLSCDLGQLNLTLCVSIFLSVQWGL